MRDAQGFNVEQHEELSESVSRYQGNNTLPSTILLFNQTFFGFFVASKKEKKFC